MHKIEKIIENNHLWSNEQRDKDFTYFKELGKRQRPQILWIGCSDSRVPAETLTKLEPGELFVHRNVGNVVIHTDLNCLSVVEYAITVLQIKHIIICGHTNCGGINAALSGKSLGIIDNWLLHIRDVVSKHQDIFNNVSLELHPRLLMQLNVVEQVYNLARATMVGNAWAEDRELTLHGWVYDVMDGYLKNMGIVVNSEEKLQYDYNNVLAKIRCKYL